MRRLGRSLAEQEHHIAMLPRFLRRAESPATSRIGVAIGTQGMLAVRVGQPFGARPVIEAASHQPVTGEADWPQALHKLTVDLGGQGLPAVIQVHGQLASLLQLAIPEVPEAERPSALKFRAREISPIPLDDMVVDYVELPGMRSRGGEATGYCAVARLSQMRALRDAVKEAGMRLEAIDVKDMALRHLLSRVLPGGESGALLLLGEHGSHIIVARSDQLYLFRSSNIRSAQLAPSDMDRIDTLMLEIQRTLDFYDSNFTDPPPRRLWLLTGQASMPHVAERLGELMRLPIGELALADVADGVQHLAGHPAELACLALGAALRPRGEGGKA